ncbi:transcriptional regulator SplA domain-containing protein [Shouchella shacheensis]|uniref:transcriptional regulator SplA domain-containing protein n=1 Tax=Shouchella shacheensis TaxID=1649580 RepID=UPI00073FB0E4|nr:transcriptional regulator SplA domain-containing protein [Shouchella shacheensis]
MSLSESYQPGQVVYVIIRNPHAQDVANVQEAAVVQNPEDPSELSLFLYETYYPLTDDVAVYQTEDEAENAYQQAFGLPEEGDFHG